MNKHSFFAIAFILVIAMVTLGMAEGNVFSTNSSDSSSEANMVLQSMIFSPDSWDFADTSCGNYRDFSFELKNQTAYSQSGNVVVSETPTFSCVSGCTYNLNSHESQYVQIRFEPYKYGTDGNWSGELYAGSAYGTVSGTVPTPNGCD
jgi:hypothetical protein